ncbi:MAG: hypothetical protein IJV20_02925, partial [Prevotella sp.]|nr:hypothetical protein [Prevotella sp.]
NQADSVFTGDSVAKVLVRYFDHPWHRPNTRMLAHYLLGRAHADMGEAPQAIEDYQTAVERAETTDDDCDFYVLSAVYGQMAMVFDEQNLPEDELSALRHYSHYCLLNGDTIAAIHGYLGLERPYYLLNDTNAIIQNADHVRKLLLLYGYHEDAAKALLMPAYYFAVRENHKDAWEAITTIKEESGLFNDNGFLTPGNEIFYYTLGLYHEGVGQLDSAEYFYRQLLPAREYEAAYRGLLSVYSKREIPDSIAKFAPLYADANDAMHRKMNSAEVHKTTSLYNYNRHLRQVRHYEHQAHLRLTWVLLILCLLLFSILILYLYHRHSQKLLQEKEQKLLKLHLQYVSVSDSLRIAQQQTSLQRRELSSFQEQLDGLTQQKEWLESQLLTNDDRFKTFHENALVGKFLLMANPANKIYSSAHEREQLILLFQSCFPSFTKAVRGLNIKEKEWMVVILTELGFQTGDMLMAARIDGNSVTMLKRSLSKKLFLKDGLATFHIDLKTAIVTGRIDF